MNEKGCRSENDEQADKDVAASDEEWETRQLCKDGNCIGVVGRDGRCRQCGLPGEENEEDRHFSMNADQRHGYTDQPQNGLTDEVLQEDDPDWSNRILCSDGNCIGVIGRDGVCKACGKPLE